RAFGRGPSREPRDRQIEAAPEKMHRAALPDEGRSELLEHPVGLKQHSPKSIRVLRIVRSVLVIFGEGNRVGNFVGLAVYADLDCKREQRIHHLAIEISHRARFKRKGLDGAVAGANKQAMIDEVEINIKRSSSIRNR